MLLAAMRLVAVKCIERLYEIWYDEWENWDGSVY